MPLVFAVLFPRKASKAISDVAPETSDYAKSSIVRPIARSVRIVGTATPGGRYPIS